MANIIEASRLTAVAAQVTTIGRARVALGRCADLLQQGYAKIDDASLWDSDELKDGLRSRLDVVNAYAGGIYATIGTADPDLQEEEISPLTCSRVGLVMAQTSEALTDVDKAIGENTFDVAETIRLALAESGRIAGSAVQAVTNAAAAGAAAFVWSAWPTLLIVGAAVAGYVAWRSGALKLGGAA